MNRKAARKYIKHSRSASWQFRLYVAGKTRRSLRALENLDSFCKNHLPGAYEIEVVDLVRSPVAAQENNIVAIPTVIKIAPGPAYRLIGDCSDTAQMLMGLDI